MAIRTSYSATVNTRRENHKRVGNVDGCFYYPLFDSLVSRMKQGKQQPHSEISPTQLAALNRNTKGLTQFDWANTR